MAEQTFKSPGFFEKEIDLSQRDIEIVGTPAGVIGTSEMGPAFIPVTVGSFSDFEKRFGKLDSKKFGPYAVNEFLKNRTALTYVRILGAGANETTTDFETTRVQGTVKAAGFRIIGSIYDAAGPGVKEISRHRGCVQFLVARHHVSASNEMYSFPEFTDNDSYGIAAGNSDVFLLRGMLFSATGTSVQVIDYKKQYGAAGLGGDTDDMARVHTASTSPDYKAFKIVISSSAGATFGSADGRGGIKIFTASLDPSHDAYISKVLNTDPERFQQDQHLLYAHFPVEDEIASVSTNNTPTVGIVSGTAATSPASGLTTLTYRDAFGRFDTRYTTPTTSYIISQPYGSQEFDIFRFETISDGDVANSKYKVSISNIRKSSDPENPYGTFTVQVRNFDDVDTNTQVVEQYVKCTLDPNDDDFIARKIGDFKAQYDFDADSEDERKIVVTGKYPNVSSRVRVQMSLDFESGQVPKDALPFGFRGIPTIKTNDTLGDDNTISGILSGLGGGARSRRLTFHTGASAVGSRAHTQIIPLTGSIVPPVPFRFKVTRGNVAVANVQFAGTPGVEERVDSRLYWGAKFERAPATASLSLAALNPNASDTKNEIIENFGKFIGIAKLDTLLTGTGADLFNNNKFTLSRVALSNLIANSSGIPDLATTANTVVTGTAKEHMLETAYIRNGRPDTTNYTVTDGQRTSRITFASLAAMTSSIYFNKFSEYAKFSTFFYGGFNGVNILDSNMSRMNDKSTSADGGGMAAASSPPASDASGSPLDIGLSSDNYFGAGEDNGIVGAYRTAIRILTDPMVSRANILAIPGIRDGAVTDMIYDRLSTYGKAIFLQDIPAYDKNSRRLYDDSAAGSPNIENTVNNFESRALDSNYSAAYFPDVSIDDIENNVVVNVPASVAAISAIAYNDKVSYPWFAPAGFNRAALDFVKNVKVRLNQSDRDDLYESRINPIASFPSAGFVIFGQKTLQMSKSALDRVNVRRMLLEIKRLIVDIANKIVFEANTPETRARFVDQVTPLLATVQIQQGIDQFKVVMDSSNNTQDDVENNILNGRIVVVPTRAVEFIAIDFIITSAGVSFE